MAQKYFNVKLTFEIPVTTEGTNVDAYYEAREKFFSYSVEEATVALEQLTEKEYKELVNTVEKLHGKRK